MTGGGAPEVSVLETPVLMLAGVMAFFLVVTGGFEWVSFNFFFFFAPSIGYAPSLDREARLFFFFFQPRPFLPPLSLSASRLFLRPLLISFSFPLLISFSFPLFLSLPSLTSARSTTTKTTTKNLENHQQNQTNQQKNR